MYAASIALVRKVPFIGGEPTREEQSQVLKAKGFTDADLAFSGKPEDRGWASEKLGVVKAYADSIDTAAAMGIDDGVVVSEWGEISKPFNVHSIRKSFLSALYGTAVATSWT